MGKPICRRSAESRRGLAFRPTYSPGWPFRSAPGAPTSSTVSVKSSAGAVGMFQLLPQFFPGAGVTWQSRCRRPRQLSESLHREFGDWQLAVAAYNWGPGNIIISQGRRDATARRLKNYIVQRVHGCSSAWIDLSESRSINGSTAEDIKLRDYIDSRCDAILRELDKLAIQWTGSSPRSIELRGLANDIGNRAMPRTEFQQAHESLSARSTR